jgi:hypothetical protein
LIDLFYLYNAFKALVNTFQGGNYPPTSVFTPTVNDISKHLWNKYTNEAEKSQEARDNLAWALRTKNIIVQASNTFYGIALPPQDYGRFAAAKVLLANSNDTLPSLEVDGGKCYKGGTLVDLRSPKQIADDYYDNVVEATVENIDTQRWGACLQHVIKKPTFEAPKMTQVNGQFKVAPRNVSVLVLYYYVKPTDATFVYKAAPPNVQTGDGDYLIYDAVNSVPLQWSENVAPEFLMELGERFGLYTRDQFLTQAMMAKNK